MSINFSQNANDLFLLLSSIILIEALIIIKLLFTNNVNKVVRPLMFRVLYDRSIKKGESIMLVYSVSVGAVVDHDVVERRLTAEVNGEVVSTEVYPPDATDLGEYNFAQGDNVKLSLVDVDDAGNASDPAVLEFVAADTLPPVSPNGLGVALLREEADTNTDEV